MSEILQLRNVSKTFPGALALQSISFNLNEGEAHCLCGENGAGKSTLIKILSGAYQPDEGGEIIFDGKKVILNPHLAMRLGIQTIYQEHVVFENLNIVENIFTGSEIVKRGLLHKSEMRRLTVDVLKYLKSHLNPDMKMSELSSGEQKTVCLVARYADPCNLFPTPGLPRKLVVLRQRCFLAACIRIAC